MKPQHAAARKAQAWLAQARADAQRRDRDVARRQAERETFGPRGRPRPIPSDPEATEATGEDTA